MHEVSFITVLLFDGRPSKRVHIIARAWGPCSFKLVCADRCSVVFLLASPQRENAKIAHRRPSNLRRIVRRVLRQVLEEQRLQQEGHRP